MNVCMCISKLRQLALGTALAASLAITGPALAQFGEAAGIAESMQPEYFRRDITVLSQGLSLDDTQRVIVEALFTDYESDFESGLTNMRKQFDDMRPELQGGDEKRVLAMVFAPFKDWTAQKNRIGDSFLENIKVVLTEDQLQQWPVVERRLYREKKLPRGKISGEALNLFVVIHDQQLDDRTKLQVQPVMDAYDVALDQALRAREGSSTGVQGDMLDALSEQKSEKSMEVLKRHIALQVAVRSVNDEYIELLAQAMPEDIGIRLRQDALERAYPRVFRPTPVQRLFKDAKELKDLAADVMQSIVQIEATYVAELTITNQQLRRAIQKQEPIEASQRAEDFSLRMQGQQVDGRVDPTRDMFLKRDDLSRTYARQLQAVLSPEQFALLPGGQRWVEEVQPAAPTAEPVQPAVLQSGRKAVKPGSITITKDADGKNER